MDFQSYFPVWNKLTPAQQERILGSLMERRVSKGTVIHNEAWTAPAFCW